MKALKHIGVLLPLLTACSADPIFSIEDGKTNLSVSCVIMTPDTTSDVTEEKALVIAKRLDTTKSRAGLENDIAETYTIDGPNGEPICHVINFADNNGYVVISAKKDIEPILAFSKMGQLKQEAINESGISVWLAETTCRVANSNTISDSVRVANNLQWLLRGYNERVITFNESRSYEDVYHIYASQLEAWKNAGYKYYELAEFRNTTEFSNLSAYDQEQITNLPYGNANKYYFGGVEHTSFIVIKATGKSDSTGPLCQTKWHQNAQFNIYVPNGYPLGCTTVAAGQIMRVHEFPETFDWSKMPYTTATSTTARFLYTLANKIGVEFAANGSSADINKVEKALKSYGYSDVQQISHNTQSVTSQITKGFPVYMRGTKDDVNVGHAWVCDGFTSSSETYEYELWCLEDCPEGIEPTAFYKIHECTPIRVIGSNYYHMNWGWSSLSDGWYSDSNISNKFGNFCLDRKDLINIYPVK